MMRFTWIQSENSEVVLNERHFESIRPVSKGAYEIRMVSGQTFLVGANAYLEVLFGVRKDLNI